MTGDEIAALRWRDGRKSAWGKKLTLAYYDISDIMVNGDVPVM
jgi:hypothetical protein